MRIVSPPTAPFRAAPRIPGDKSLSHRALILAAMADGESRVSGIAPGQDVAATAGAVRRLGVVIEGELVRSPGVTRWLARHGPLDAANSGTTLRLLAGALAARPYRTTLTGDGSLRRRPMRRLVGPLEALGAEIDLSPNGTAPLVVGAASPLRGCDVSLDLPSAQVRSAFELAAVQANGGSSIDSPAGFRDHTERWLEALGRGRRIGSARFEVEPGPIPVAAYPIAADTSSAAFLWSAAALVRGASVETTGVSLNPGRTGFLEILVAMGAAVEVEEDGDVLGDPVGKVRVTGSSLHGVRVDAELSTRAMDELPLVAVLAGAAEGDTMVGGAAELHTKESDRISTTVAMIRNLGGRAEPTDDGFVVSGGRGFRGGIVDAGGDHRIAMAAGVAAAASRGTVAVTDEEAAAVSWPGFFDFLEATWSSR